jgi:tetratricopeptide (TPR) repeat protein
MAVDISRQNFVIARLADYCDFRKKHSASDTKDPISYLWYKLQEIEGPLLALKQGLLTDAVEEFFKDLGRNQMTEDKLADFKQLLDSYLERGVFADAAFHLDRGYLKDPDNRKTAEKLLRFAKVYNTLDEEDKDPEKRNKNWDRLVGDIYKRLEFHTIAKCHNRKALTARRLRFFVRRIRFQSADFCAVFRFPVNHGDTFSPFMLPRAEALIGANRRILHTLRTLPSNL